MSASLSRDRGGGDQPCDAQNCKGMQGPQGHVETWGTDGTRYPRALRGGGGSG